VHLSVVIPTRDRLDKLRRTLDALCAQEVDRQRLEVIVVDDGEGTAAAAEDHSAGHGLVLRGITRTSPGVSAARNAGMRAATGDVVVFLGDDTSPAAPDVLGRHLALYEARPEATYGVLGRVDWAPQLTVTPLMRWLERDAQFDFANMTAGAAGPEHLYTSHVSLKRSLLLEVGGFDERLEFLFEDGELGLRLFARGLELDYRPELVVHHDHPIALGAWLERERAAGHAARRLHTLEAGHGAPSGGARALAPRAKGPRWGLDRVLGAALARLPTEWGPLPVPLRDWVYTRLHNGAYAAGYRASR